jgi:serine O-acetyltransferase
MAKQAIAITPDNDPIWDAICEETAVTAKQEPVLASFLHSTILNHRSLESALSFHLAQKLESPAASALILRDVIAQALCDPAIGIAVRCDLSAVIERDSACDSYSVPFLYFKGFHALQAYRVAHWLWQQQRQSLALFLQNCISTKFSVDIHPAAKIGRGTFIDHATGVVIGETTVIGDNVSILQSVTLGGTGKEDGDRHPKVGNGVLISAGAKILGNISIGDGAKIGAGSVVLQNIPAHTTAAGVPARVVGRPASQQPSLDMNHGINCDMDCTLDD